MAQGMLQEYLDFFRAFTSKPKFMGAIAPSSRDLAKMMVRGLDLKSASLVIEIGPGTGAFTKVILEQLRDPSRYLGIDLNPEFIRKLRLKFPGAHFYHGSAEHLAQIVANHGGPKQADYVICGLPWAVFPTELQKRILGGIAGVLREGGRFSTFTYLHAIQLPQGRRFRRMLHRHFGRVEISPVVWKNIPPAVSYHCTRIDKFKASRPSDDSRLLKIDLARFHREPARHRAL